MSLASLGALCVALFLSTCDSPPTAPPPADAGHDPTCDGVDDDGDGLVDEGYAPTPTACGVGQCTAVGQLVCIDGALADDCLPDDPLYDDDNCDGHDDDCDGAVDESFEGGACEVPRPLSEEAG